MFIEVVCSFFVPNYKENGLRQTRKISFPQEYFILKQNQKQRQHSASCHSFKDSGYSLEHFVGGKNKLTVRLILPRYVRELE